MFTAPAWVMIRTESRKRAGMVMTLRVVTGVGPLVLAPPGVLPLADPPASGLAPRLLPDTATAAAGSGRGPEPDSVIALEPLWSAFGAL
jgi:hypothetical protein